MEQLLWSLDDLKRLTRHSDAPVCRWAIERLINLYPTQASDEAVALLACPEHFTFIRAVDYLVKTGDAETYGPILLERLQHTSNQDDSDKLIRALGELGYRPAIPVLLNLLRQPETKLIPSLRHSFSPLLRALGELGGDEVRRALWPVLEQQTPDGEALIPTLEAIVQVATPDDLPRLIQYYRTLPRGRENKRWPFGIDYKPLLAFANRAQAGRLYEEIESYLDEDIYDAIEQAEWWLSAPPQLSDEFLDELEDAFDHHLKGTFEIFGREAERLLSARGDDVAGWLSAWQAGETLSDYRQRTAFTWIILKEFAALPSTFMTRRRQEAALGLALLCQLSVERDDLAYLEAAADKTAALLEILAAPNEHVLPNIIERVVALGPAIASAVIDRLDADAFDWGAIRLINTVTQLARAYPGSCDAAIPTLIDYLHEDQSDFICEAVGEALRVIGPAAVPLIKRRLRGTTDTTQEIYLTGALGDIPVAGATDLILDKLLAGEEIDEGELMTLGDNGSAAAIEPLYHLWKPGDYILAEELLVLCLINNVDKPELPEWRRLVQETDERNRNLFLEEIDTESVQETLAASSKLPAIRTWRLDKDTLKALRAQHQPARAHATWSGKAGKNKRKKR